MPVEHEFIVPEYYPSFVCKGGACRSTCCRGWGISVTLDEYFLLLSLSCSKELRARLDCAFHMADDPSPERYALISPRFDGDCPLHLENGWCGLQAECGEQALTTICRYYPRGARRHGDIFECSCANSCEHTLEMLFSLRSPLTFVRKNLTFSLPFLENNKADDFDARYLEVRKKTLEILQNRTETLADRLRRLGRFIGQASESAGLPKTQYVLPISQPDLAFSLPVQLQLLTVLEQTSTSLAQEAPLVEKTLHLTQAGELPKSSIAEYTANVQHLEAIFPDLEIYFEQMLVNHLFFESFPYSDRHEDMWHAYMALCGGYALLRLIAVGGMAKKETMEDFIDLMARAFRAIEHSRFDWNAAVVLHQAHCDTQDALDRLLIS